MKGTVNIAGRIVAISYTLVILAMVWFTFLFFGFDFGGDFSGLIVFFLLALSPIPVCSVCFRKN
ncbi:hypothetical protein ASE67_05375 [Sphingomonas sp. Leaf23]|nr:hypothetical protein ASE67_05375 [Sphingomonas sp. Leaf23]